MDMSTTTTQAPATSDMHDPILDRAMFFMDLELAELTGVIPQAAAPEAKFVY